jgi:ABC-2 type transport system permease protein
MSRWAAIKLVTRREIVERVREKAFLYSTAVSLLLIAGVAALPALIGDDDGGYDVGFVGVASSEIQEVAADPTLSAVDVVIRPKEFDDRAAAESALEAEEIDAAVVDGEELIGQEEVPPELQTYLQEVSSRLRLLEALNEAGLSPGQIQEALNPAPLQVSALDPPDEDQAEKSGLATIGSIILFLQVFGYGYWVSMGVVEEKSSRVVEIILAKIRPAQLLAGKVIGIGLLGLMQLILVVGVGLIIAVVTGSIELPSGTGEIIALILVWFLLGYAFYSSAFAVSGALVSRVEELQSSTAPMSILLFASYFIGISATNNPDSTLAAVASYLPPSAPLAMPQRAVLGEASAVEVVLSMVITLAATAALIPIAGRLYSGGILRMGGVVKLREAWRSAA